VAVIGRLAPNPEPDIVTVVPTGPDVGDNVSDDVTVNVAVAVLVPSLASTVWEPAVEAGTVNVTPENDPEAPVVTVAGVVVSGTPSYVNVTVWEAPKPEPDIVTVVPTAPDVGDNLADDVTVNVADGVLVPSLATTVWEPAVEAGTVNVQPDRLPDVFVVHVPPSVSAVPSYVAVIGRLAPNPEPDIVTVVPTGPDVGDNVIDDVTVNVTDAMLLKLSTATTVWEPAVEAGTVNVTPENDPDPSGVTVATVVPSYLIVTLLAGRNSPHSLTL
jgi:hypothetical protein